MLALDVLCIAAPCEGCGTVLPAGEAMAHRWRGTYASPLCVPCAVAQVKAEAEQRVGLAGADTDPAPEGP